MAKTIWEDLPSTATPINATNLNKMEDRLVNVSGEVDATYTTNIETTNNIFKSRIIRGNVSDSQIQSSTTRICTADFIKVKPSTTYTLSFKGNLGNINICYFTSNAFPRESESSWVSNFTFTTKASTNYILIAWRKSSNNETVYVDDISYVTLVEGTKSDLKPNNVIIDNKITTTGVNIDNVPSSDNRITFIKSTNLVDPNSVELYNGYFNSGRFTNDDDNRTLYVPIQPNTTYVIEKPFTTNRLRACLTDAPPSTSTSINNYNANDSGKTITITNTNYQYLCVFYWTSTDTKTKEEILNGITIKPNLTPKIVVDGEDLYNPEKTNIYSTSEQKIGLWINNKPIYRLVYQFTISQNASVYTLSSLGINNVDDFVRLYGIVKSTDAGSSTYVYEEDYYTASTDYTRLLVYDNSLHVDTGNTYPVKPYTLYVIFEYTKTTD